jgi:hypothetical protein
MLSFVVSVSGVYGSWYFFSGARITMDWTTRVRLSVGRRDLFLFYSVPTRSEGYPFSNPISIGDCVRGIKVARA